LSKNKNGIVSRDDRHRPSPILCDTVTLFVSTDQLLCHYVFIYSHFYWQLIVFLRDGSLHFVCLLSEPNERRNHSIKSDTSSMNRTPQICNRTPQICNPVIPPPSMPCTTFCFVCFYRPAFCRVCVFMLWTSCLLINN